MTHPKLVTSLAICFDNGHEANVSIHPYDDDTQRVELRFDNEKLSADDLVRRLNDLRLHSSK